MGSTKSVLVHLWQQTSCLSCSSIVSHLYCLPHIEMFRWGSWWGMKSWSMRICHKFHLPAHSGRASEAPNKTPTIRVGVLISQRGTCFHLPFPCEGAVGFSQFLVYTNLKENWRCKMGFSLASRWKDKWGSHCMFTDSPQI